MDSGFNKFKSMYLSVFCKTLKKVLINFSNFDYDKSISTKNTKMKKLLILLLLPILILSDISCKKAIDDVLDCIGESLFVVVHADLDSINPKLMHFEFVYNPREGFELETSINWNFGDGHAVVGATTIDHEYENTGNYDAIVSYTLKKGSGTCSSNSTKHIVIN